MRKKRVAIVMAFAAAAAALIVLGLFQLVNVYRRYREDMLNYENSHLNSIVTTSARSLDVLLDAYSTMLTQLENRHDFTKAEENYTATGNTAGLKALLSRQNNYSRVPPFLVGAYDENGNLLAASDAGYPRYRDSDEALGNDISMRRDDEGGFWLIVDDSSRIGFRYEIAISIQSMFSEHASYSRVGENGYLFLMDRAGMFFSFYGADDSGTSSVEDFLASHPNVDADALAELRAVDLETTGSRIMHYTWAASTGRDDGGEETLVAVCPLTKVADGLVLGAAVSIQEFDNLLSGMVRQVTLAILLEIAGALLLFLMLAWIMVVNRRNALALEASQKKAELMEEIGRQQQALYHGERLQQLGLMTSGVIHEFNNLLTPIMSQTHLLIEEMADQQDSPLFDSALDLLEAEEDAREVLRRMSDIGKRQADVEFHMLELRALLRRTMDLSAMVKKNEIRRELDLPDRPLYVEGSDQLLTQAFLNLCINATQAMGDTGTLTLRAELEERSGRKYARVEVSDTGPGIPEEMFSSLYEPFFTTKGAQGTGLGLAICRKIVESHKGTISAANRPEGGAVFTVRIPISPTPPDAEE